MESKGDWDRPAGGGGDDRLERQLGPGQADL
jgi:hypothetical protein